MQVELKLPFVPKPSDNNQHESAEESDQSDGTDKVDSLKEEFSTMSLNTKKGKEKVRDSNPVEVFYKRKRARERHSFRKPCSTLKVKCVIQRHHFSGFVSST